MERKNIPVKIKKQDHPHSSAYWQTFEVPYKKNLNVIGLLMELRFLENVHQSVAWEAACLEEVCGTCSMIINGKPRQACTALVDQLTWPISLEPFSKFPVVRDLIVDRSRMFQQLKQVKAWVEIDGTHDLGPGLRQSAQLSLERYKMSECMSCGCCLEACPQYGPQNAFVGPAAINQVNLFNQHPIGQFIAPQRLDALMQPGGIVDCGDAQNCVKACPKKIPLTESIAKVSRQVTLHALKKLFE